jgi:hypothetical protein
VQFTCEDLEELAALVAQAWRAGADRDWAARAGSLGWSCTRTADHVIDTVLAPAFFLASRRTDDYPVGEPFTLGADPQPADLADGVEMAARILAAVVTAAPADVRAIIWRFPVVETRPPDDFVPRGGLELALHAHDIGCGLGIPFVPPADLCERLRAHTQAWPHWTAPGWSPPAMEGDPWVDLLQASGRSAHDE